MPKSASGFTALQVRTGDASPAVRYLYLKPHTDPAEGAGTALFVAGLGYSYDETILDELFSVFGSVSQVALHANKVSGTLCTFRAASLPVLTVIAYADISSACFQKRKRRQESSENGCRRQSLAHPV